MAKHICQGPRCHTYDTQSRVRGVKGAKVLRTRNARYHTNDPNTGWIANWEYYFCDERCMNNWLDIHMVQLISFVGLKTKPQETPVDVVKETINRTDWSGRPYSYVNTTIKLLNEQDEDDTVNA